MDRWRGKVAVVTGASSGIGLAVAKALVRDGVIVVGLARRRAKMEVSVDRTLGDAISQFKRMKEMKDAEGPGKFYARECDITKKESVNENFNWIEEHLGALNILINNAGVVKHSSIEECSVENLEQIVNVNLFGVLYCVKRAIPLMKRNETEAHVVNINSLLGHKVPEVASIFNVYPATKFAVTALSETLSIELRNSKIRVSNISPGLVKTEMLDSAAARHSVFNSLPALDSADVASAVLFALGAPAHVEINEIILQAKCI